MQQSIIMCQGRGQFFGSMDATAIHDHHDLFGGFAKDVHDLVNILAQGFCVKMRHDLIEDFRGAILDAPMTLSNTPLVMRLHERYWSHACRLRDSSRLI